ncbi:hypothetical protein A2574_03300 [Candidatus Shapirobacteria bacterium RIFOXYD1_FULL_38_32]|uniref:Uncharacterized protein n=3 Tax=Candidatus Shapironibacteriota TaxID=1752721 RepID=A0A0G0JUX6_9BACT|nr:MAG: hypothetical protein US90_C0006G0010 [Candidatus Shapirobacteria bacterium GW2011_GWE2_38_30]KKQ90443.1 MAG: hypothetical protein UT14_C0036G0004 [Candidatus Shapirobacteria bacterium GW2011_GWE1_38_92]OGL56286.1 MAG: hypothetical protein A2195_00935 [Candidatus Shapirobacteria bacterium RIFOXYA1_FULL_39_17]OGL57384.1 MAG: hypothetical protein A2367_01660 [Candidatus Shapirobacteria bacterium RIFOXYB1_FULL_38_38]OGL58078.1 MAG: hypothetical protein A2574_03300 [Candidatus Shapirobacteri
MADKLASPLLGEVQELGAIKEQYRLLTMKQSTVNWGEEDRLKLLELKKILGIDQPLSEKTKEALHRQGLADTVSVKGGSFNPGLNKEEIDEILNANAGNKS